MPSGAFRSGNPLEPIVAFREDEGGIGELPELSPDMSGRIQRFRAVPAH